MDILVKNAIIVLPDRVIEGDISVADGKIAAIGERFSGSATQVIDAGRGHVIPGIIDLHGDDIEFEIGALGPKASARRMPVDLGLIQSDKNAAGWGITTKFHAIAYFEEESKGRSKRLSSEIMDSIARLAEAEHLLVDHWVDLQPTRRLTASSQRRTRRSSTEFSPRKERASISSGIMLLGYVNGPGCLGC
jgi:alpha-D-ribose 1-methylphosphonate 5-triphosphate diphosphatase